MIETKTTPLDIAELTHSGKVRPENQDRHASFTVPLGEVCLVADGMGGHKGGARAAELATLWTQQSLARADVQFPVAEALRVAVHEANANIYAEAQSEPALNQMGSTLVMALVQDGRVTIAHVGDSRAYLFRQGTLRRLTRDHNLMEPLIASGALTEEQARHHYQASVLTKALGPQAEVEPTVAEPFRLEPGDRLMLCSDGLCGYVPDSEIESAMRAEPDAQRAAARLLQMAMDTGGEDNITVQVIGHGSPVALPVPVAAVRSVAAPPVGGGNAKWTMLAAGMLVLLMGGSFVGWRTWQDARLAAGDRALLVVRESPQVPPPAVPPATPEAKSPAPAVPPPAVGKAPAGVPPSRSSGAGKPAAGAPSPGTSPGSKPSVEAPPAGLPPTASRGAPPVRKPTSGSPVTGKPSVGGPPAGSPLTVTPSSGAPAAQPPAPDPPAGTPAAGAPAVIPRVSTAASPKVEPKAAPTGEPPVAPAAAPAVAPPVAPTAAPAVAPTAAPTTTSTRGPTAAPPPITAPRKPNVVLLCVPSCPVDGPAAEVVKAMRADRAIALQEKALPENHGAFAKKKKAPFVFVRNTADLPLAAPWAAALGVFPSGRVSDKVEEALRRQNAGSDILVLVRAN